MGLPNKFDVFDLAVANGQRPHNYWVGIEFPQPIALHLALSEPVLDVLAMELQMPNPELENVQIGICGRRFNYPMNKKHDNTVDITFVFTENHVGCRLFEFWLNSLDRTVLKEEDTPISLAAGGGVMGKAVGAIGKAIAKSRRTKAMTASEKAEKDKKLVSIDPLPYNYDPTGTLKISPKNYGGFRTYTYILHNAYPCRIQKEQFSTNNTDALMKYTVTFAYAYTDYDNKFKIVDFM